MRKRQKKKVSLFKINQDLSVRHGMSQYGKQTFAHFVSCLLCEIRTIL
jgi:hypothetical protein